MLSANPFDRPRQSILKRVVYDLAEAAAIVIFLVGIAMTAMTFDAPATHSTHTVRR